MGKMTKYVELKEGHIKYRKFTKKQCTPYKKVKGFSKRSSCAPYKDCKKRKTKRRKRKN